VCARGISHETGMKQNTRGHVPYLPAQRYWLVGQVVLELASLKLPERERERVHMHAHTSVCATGKVAF
jgi:hypothetical protein